MLRNYLLCAGTTWYFQFFFYAVSESRMGRYKFSSRTQYMASIIIFSSLRGNRVQSLAAALFLLVASTLIIGYGSYLGLAAK